jgi:hypothetical protein
MLLRTPSVQDALQQLGLLGVFPYLAQGLVLGKLTPLDTNPSECSNKERATWPKVQEQQARCHQRPSGTSPAARMPSCAEVQRVGLHLVYLLYLDVQCFTHLWLCVVRADAAYLHYVTLMNQVVMMGTQIYHDACDTQHHKYVAHELALLYVSIHVMWSVVCSSLFASASSLLPS